MVRVITNDDLCCEITLNPASYNLIKLSCNKTNTDLSPSITAIDLSSRTKNGDILHSIVGLHENSENAHKTLFNKKADISNLADVATSGDYNDLSNKPNIPTIPEINNGTLTITQNGTTKGTFRANQNENTTIEISTDLNGKADVDLSNTNNQAKILMSGMGMPSGNWITVPLGASGTQYIAPANGWYVALLTNIYANGNLWFRNISKNGFCSSMVRNAFDGGWFSTNIPCQKGDVVECNYDSVTFASSDNYFRFYYAQGSESEAQ